MYGFTHDYLDPVNTQRPCAWSTSINYLSVFTPLRRSVHFHPPPPPMRPYLHTLQSRYSTIPHAPHRQLFMQ